jgi:DNA polymerase-3 subunit gamma/tau
VEKYVVSARKYRPIKFSDVVGQSHVTMTLENAIKNEKIAQSILFCGPRGVGKTTCARILANEINGFNIENPLESSNNLNIYELDAASNNSVDDIRNLIDQVRYPPQSGKYKVYIIDEVHMLSNAAFNAFLKTLEEPPSYAIFILATTEKNKVIPTILSRCQIYDFTRIEIIDIKNKLKEILENEKIEFEDDALHIIAQKADGAMRDALSTLDLIRTFSKDSKITLDVVTKNLNILDSDYFFKISNLLFEASISETLLIHNEILLNGFESYNLLNGLSNHFRNLLLSQNEKLIEIMEVSEAEKEKYLKQANTINPSFIENALEILNEFEIQYRQASNHKIHTEIALIKICSLNKKKTLKPEESIINQPKKEIKKSESLEEIKENSIENKAQISEKEEPINKETPNLKNLLVEKKEIISEKNKIEKIEKIPFSSNEFNNLIESFADSLKEKKSEVAILKKRSSIDDNKITFHLDNELEGTIFDSILNRLKEKLKNRFIEKIELKKKINQSEKEKTIYTNKDKFEYLAKKNSNLTDLKNKLGLDYEF